MAKTEEKIEANSGEMVKQLMIRGVACADEDKPGTSSQKKVASAAKDKPEALNKKKVAATAEDNPKSSITERSVTTADDEPKASSKKMVKKVKSMGLIFLCNSKTKQDCYQYKVLGLPASKKDLVQKIYKGMRLFLFDIDLRLMYGIYKAAGPGGYNIQPKAFGSAFPSQVRFAVSEDCLPVAEEKFKPILKENYYAKNKFDCQLNSEQVKKLCKLFNGSGRVSKSKKLKNVVGTETHPGADRARSWRLMVDGKRLGRGRIRRQVLDEESVEQGRIRQQILDEERLDRDRIRRQRPDERRLDQGRVRRQKLDEENWEPLYHDHPILYERERYASSLSPPSLAYDSYGRIAETAMYIRDPVVDHRDRVPVLEHHGRVSAVDHRDLRILDLDVRRREEVGIRDPYTSYGAYDPAPREQAVTYVPLVSSASKYHHDEALRYEYGPPQPLYRY